MLNLTSFTNLSLKVKYCEKGHTYFFFQDKYCIVEINMPIIVEYLLKAT